MMIVIKESKAVDEESLVQIDASVETTIIWNAVRVKNGFELQLVKVQPPLKKNYSLSRLRDHASPCDHGWIAEANGRIVGFIGIATQPRQKRCVIWHFYVDREHRKCGIGRSLMSAVEAYARESDLNLLWVETQNVNAPAIAAYRALGFDLCGLDTTLYHGTSESGETALYFARPID